jgi:CRP-like cAMP-binding protein
MTMLESEPFFEGLKPRCLRLLADCVVEHGIEAGRHLLREHEPAVAFYLIRSGQVVLEANLPGRGPTPFQTLGPGSIVGWSWLLAPYRSYYDARAVTDVLALRFDAAALRRRMDRDPACGYAILKCFTVLIVQRLQAARLQGLDIYGDGEPGHDA